MGKLTFILAGAAIASYFSTPENRAVVVGAFLVGSGVGEIMIWLVGRLRKGNK